jgi:CDGSH-type Zn-finger protein
MNKKTIKLDDNNLPERATMEIKPGEKVALCRCWQSKKFPYCDGAHRQLNEEQGCCLGPIIITAIE